MQFHQEVFNHVLKGEIEFLHVTERYLLSSGDGLCFDAHITFLADREFG